MTTRRYSSSAFGAAIVLSMVGCVRDAHTSKVPSPPHPSARDASSVTSTGSSTVGGKLAFSSREDWFDFRFHGSKVGFMYGRDEASPADGPDAFHAHRWSVLVVRRQHEVVRMESKTDAWFLGDGTPLHFEHTRREGEQVRSIAGRAREDGSFAIRNDTGGSVTETTLPREEGRVLASSLDVLFGRGLAVGKKKTGRAILEEEGVVADYALTVSAEEKHAVHGTVFIVDGTVAGIASRSLVRGDGRAVEVTLPALGAEFLATTKEDALKMPEPVDIFSAAMFPIATALPDRDRLGTLVVGLTSRSGATLAYVESERQTAKVRNPSSLELSIVRQVAPTRAPKLPMNAKAPREFLIATPYEPLGDPSLVAASRRAVGDAKDAWTAVRRIEAFVFRHIEEKTLSRAFATARETLDSKKGDCTEHAVLFSALAKIAGVPTRLVTGLVYVGGPERRFGYHAWNEVWMGAEGWIAVDPTFGQEIADATHIAFTRASSDPDGLRQAGVVAAGLIGDLELEVVRTEPAPVK